MELEKQLNDIKTSLETKAVEDTKKAVESAVAEVKNQLKEAETKAAKAETEVTELKAWQVKKDEADKKNQEIIDKWAREKKHGPIGQPETKSFNQVLCEAVEKNADKIRNYKPGDNLKIDLLPDHMPNAKKEEREIKAVGDMTIANNFPGAASLYQDRRTDMIMNPYNRVWIADILPQGSSTGTSVVYPKENGGEGSVGLWEDPTVNKPQMDIDLTTQTAYFKWLAGIAIIDREMLDDVALIQSYLQSKMLISLKTAENAFILNGTSGTNPVTGLLQAATPYDGEFTDGVRVIVDAGWGQIVEQTEMFYSPTHMLLNPRTAVAIGLNQATGSGEFDLPAGSVAFANGKLTVAGMDNVSTTSLAADNFVVFDRTALMFIRRMQPELRIFEDSILAKINKVMFRIEERATLLIFNDEAIVKGTIAGAGSF